MKSVPQVVIDTNVIVAALRSKQGASYRLLRLIDAGKFEVNVSVPLVLEYEAAAKEMLRETALTAQDVDDIVDYICSVANRRRVHYLWRPFSPDPKDDMVVELAVTVGCGAIITFNKKDFHGTEKVGVRVVTPAEFLREIGEIP